MEDSAAGAVLRRRSGGEGRRRSRRGCIGSLGMGRVQGKVGVVGMAVVVPSAAQAEAATDVGTWLVEEVITVEVAP